MFQKWTIQFLTPYSIWEHIRKKKQQHAFWIIGWCGVKHYDCEGVKTLQNNYSSSIIVNIINELPDHEDCLVIRT